MTRVLNIVAVAFGLAVIGGATIALFLDLGSTDLMSARIAGHFWLVDRSDLVFRRDHDGLFRMLPPPEWRPFASQATDALFIFPYIYPPLWLLPGAWMDLYLTEQDISRASHLINALLVLGMLVLAIRASVASPARPFALIASVMGCALLTPFTAALSGSQPQILVAFLSVLAAERATAGKPMASGVALALAASIKLYPALFCVIYIARRDWKALTSFGLSGLALAGASIAVGGWALHLEYLGVLSDVSRSIVLTNYSASLDSFLTTLFLQDSMTVIRSLDSTTGAVPESWWFMTAKPVWLRIFDLVALVTALGLTGWFARRRTNDGLVWPFAMMAITLVSPLAWTFHYIGPLAFAPALALRLRLAIALPILAAALAPISVITVLIVDRPDLVTPYAVPGLIVLTIGLVLAVTSRRRAEP